MTSMSSDSMHAPGDDTAPPTDIAAMCAKAHADPRTEPEQHCFTETEAAVVSDLEQRSMTNG